MTKQELERGQMIAHNLYYGNAEQVRRVVADCIDGCLRDNPLASPLGRFIKWDKKLGNATVKPGIKVVL